MRKAAGHTFLKRVCRHTAYKALVLYSAPFLVTVPPLPQVLYIKMLLNLTTNPLGMYYHYLHSKYKEIQKDLRGLSKDTPLGNARCRTGVRQGWMTPVVSAL